MDALRTSLASMQYGNEDFLADLVADACSKSCDMHVTFRLVKSRRVENPHCSVAKMATIRSTVTFLLLSRLPFPVAESKPLSSVLDCPGFTCHDVHVAILLSGHSNSIRSRVLLGKGKQAEVTLLFCFAATVVPSDPRNFNVDNVRVTKILVSSPTPPLSPSPIIISSRYTSHLGSFAGGGDTFFTCIRWRME